MKINAQVTKRLRVGVSLLGNLRYNTDPIYGVSTTVNIINRALPIFGTQLPDGKWLSTWLSTPGRNNPENPLMELHEGNTKRQLHRIWGASTSATTCRGASSTTPPGLREGRPLFEGLQARDVHLQSQNS